MPTEDGEGERERLPTNDTNGRVSRRGAEAQREGLPTEHTEDTEGERESVKA